MYLGPGSQRAVLSIHASCGPATAAGGGAGRGCCRYPFAVRSCRGPPRSGGRVRRGHVRNRAARDAASRRVRGPARAATGRGVRDTHTVHPMPALALESTQFYILGRLITRRKKRRERGMHFPVRAPPHPAQPGPRPRGGDRWNKCAELRRWSPTRLANLHATHVTARHAAP